MRVICEDSAWGAVEHVPGRSSIKALVETLRRAGASSAAADAVMLAMERFEDTVQTHSGDRDTFEVMIGSVSDQSARRRGEASRKMFFQGCSAIWGVRARLQLSIHIVAPSAKAGMLDTAVVAGLMDFRRLRSDVAWTVASMSTLAPDGTPQSHPDLGPIDPAVEPGRPPILRQFCSDPVPELRSVPGPFGATRHEFTEGPIGNTALATCILGWVARGELGRYRTGDDTIGEHIVRLNTPVETLYHDLYVHRGLEFASRPRAFLHNCLPGAPVFPYDGRERSRLPLAEEMIDLGEGPPAATAPEIPSYRQMVDLAMQRLGRPLEEFHGYRLRLRYPPIPTQAMYRYDLDGAP